MRRLLALVLLLLAACDEPANVAVPLTGPPGVAFDPDLAGVWTVVDTGQDEDGAVLLAMTGVMLLWPVEDGLRVQGSVHLSELRPAGEAPRLSSMMMEWIARPARIADRFVASARIVDGGHTIEPGPDGRPVVTTDPQNAPHPDRGWWVFAVARPDPDTLELRYLSSQEMARAAHARGLPLREVPCGPRCVLDVHDLDEARLRALIGEVGFDILFAGDPIVLHRARSGALGGLR